MTVIPCFENRYLYNTKETVIIIQFLQGYMILFVFPQSSVIVVNSNIYPQYNRFVLKLSFCLSLVFSDVFSSLDFRF